MKLVPNLPRAKRLLNRAWLRRGVSFVDLASSSRQLCPPYSGRLPKAFYLEETLDRVKSISPWRNWKIECASMRGEEVEYGPAIAYVVENAEMVGAYIYANASKTKVGWGSEQLTIGELEEDIDCASLVSTDSGSEFFGCLLLDDFLLEILAREFAPAVRMPTKNYVHEDDYRRVLSLPPPPLFGRARVSQLTIFDLPAVTPLRAGFYQRMRNSLRENLDYPYSTGAPGVFIRRGEDGAYRNLKNESQVEEWFATAGFEIVDPSTQSVDEIIRRSMNAKIIAGVEGSQLSHALFTVADGGAFLVLQPPERFALPYKEFTDCLDMHFAFAVGEAVDGGFVISISELDKLCGMLGA